MAKRKIAAQEAAPTDEPTTLAESVDQVVADARQRAEDTSFDPATLDRPPAARHEQGQPLPSLGRAWTERYEQPVKYAHSTFKDPMGKELIAFRFDLPRGRTKPDDAIIDVMREHKYFKDGKPNGLAPDAKSDSESYPTGLNFQNLPRGGKAWVIQNDAMGRTVADSIDQALDGLAKKIENGVGGPG